MPLCIYTGRSVQTRVSTSPSSLASGVRWLLRSALPSLSLSLERLKHKLEACVPSPIPLRVLETFSRRKDAEQKKEKDGSFALCERLRGQDEFFLFFYGHGTPQSIRDLLPLRGLNVDRCCVGSVEALPSQVHLTRVGVHTPDHPALLIHAKNKEHESLFLLSSIALLKIHASYIDTCTSVSTYAI